jgi:acylphosphatase
MLRAHRLLIAGRVQGVGFRWYAVESARQEGLAGWVRNCDDGRVDVWAEGDAEALARFERRLWQGPRGARVDDVQSEDVVPTGTHDFEIRT